MLHRFLLLMLSSLLLSACGRGTDDFAVTVQRPADRVAASFGEIPLDKEFSQLVPGLKVVRTEPKPNEVLYTVPGDGKFPASIKLTFEPSADGQTTTIHAAVDVPSTEVEFAGKTMVISESKVEKMLRDMLGSAKRKLEQGGDITSEKRELAKVLTVLAIITDSKKLRLAQNVAKYPEWYTSGLGWMGGGDGDYASYPYGDHAMGEDPGSAAREDQYKEQAAQERAAEPMDEARGDSARGESAQGDYSGGSDY